MCGIAGFSGNFDRVLLERMNDTQAHRGPDDHGAVLLSSKRGAESIKHIAQSSKLKVESIHQAVSSKYDEFGDDTAPDIGLAHCRLSIIDVSSAGHQPMGNEGGTVWITYNGEIYNHKDLRSKLEAKGHAFKSRSDTEVILHGYEEWDVGVLDHIIGIFAFAIWDSRSNSLFLARDGLGVKPLYYTLTPNGFLFASELKALLQEPSVDRTFNFEAIHYYLSYLWCPAPHTMLKSICKLEPGYALVVRNGKIQKKWCFYDLPYGQEPFNTSETEIARDLAEKIREAVHRQMVSDVPVGAFLSGGLDSSTVVAFARQMNPDQKLDCFTIGFENSTGKFDGFAEDLPYAQKVAEYLDVDLHTITVGPDMVSRIEEMIYFIFHPPF